LDLCTLGSASVGHDKPNKGHNDMKHRYNGSGAHDALARHERKCTICRHADCEAIEEEFVHWRDVWQIARQYGIEDYRSIYRHARATVLVELRRENIRSALDNIVEHSDSTKVSGDCILRAIRAYSCIDDMGRWIDPPSRVVFTTTGVNAPLPVAEAPQAEEAAYDECSATPPLLDPDSSPDPALLPAPAEACHAASPQRAEFQAAPLGKVHSPQPTKSLIYGTGIRNHRNSLKTHDKALSNIR
jgi:hypothetical protein